MLQDKCYKPLARLSVFVAILAVASSLVGAQTTASGPDAQREADLITAYKILVNEGILDSFGHVSVRSSKDPNIFFMPRAMPPALVSQDDLMELRVSDSQPIDPKGRRVNGERYIHGEIYKARPDVMSVIHSHSQAVIPLSLTAIKLKPVIAQAGFLPPATPTFEIRDTRMDGDRGMQVTDSARGAALARTLSSYPVALMRGHGEVVVGSSVKQAVVYAAYVDINARMQTQASGTRHRHTGRARAVHARGVRHQSSVGASQAKDAGRRSQGQGRSCAVRARSNTGEAIARGRDECHQAAR